ncbi:MAG TPA: endonuclease/exonuclease/phosphatase family protein, partial [Longimicrobiales bacterium]
EASVLGSAPVGAQWTGVPYPLLAALLVVAGGVATALLLASREPAGRPAPAAAGLAVAVVAGALAAWGWEGWGAAAAFVGGHVAALLLLGRALAPAGGRRGGWTVTAALAVFLLFSVCYAFTYFYAFTFRSFQGAAPRILALAGAVLFTATLLVPLPRPTPPPPLRRRVVAAALTMLALAAAVPAWIGWRDEVVAERANPPAERVDARAERAERADAAAAGAYDSAAARTDDPATAATDDPAAAGADDVASESPPAAQPALELRVATYNVHYGFGEDWRYAPEAMAATIAEAGADVVALQEVSVGLASAYGTDLARWLGRRLGMRVRFAPTLNGALGDAVLSRLPVVAFQSVPLPPADADRKQVAVAEIAAGPDTLRVLATHFGLSPAERAAQTAGVLDAAGAGPAILAGDLNAGPDSDVARRLAAAGFRDAFELAGAAPAPTSPAIVPTERIDWIWLRGYDAVEARVLDSTAS